MRRFLQYKQLVLGLLTVGLLLGGCVRSRELVYMEGPASVKSSGYAYQIQPGDIFHINVSSALELTTSTSSVGALEGEMVNSSQHPYLKGYEVEQNGTLMLPLIGRVTASGLTVQQLRDTIIHISQDYIAEPFVQLYQLNFQVNVLGQVNQPGLYNIYNYEPNIFNAIALAGDMNEWGKRESVKVIRTQGENVEVMYLDLTSSEVVQNPGFYIQPGDVIHVETRASKQFSGNVIQISLGVISTTMSILTLLLINN